MKLPTCLIGFVRGNLRWESCAGGVTYSKPWANYLISLRMPNQLFLDEGMYAISHLQKKSRLGFLLMQHEKFWHLCFHVWFTIRYQAQKSDGSWIPGTECVLYWRIGYSRWEVNPCAYVKGWIKRIWKFEISIPFGTWFLGTHWD